MKAYSTIIIIFFLSLNWGYAQTHGRIKVQVVKENAEIDGLVKLILDPKTPVKAIYGDTNQAINCISIRFERHKDGKRYSFLVGTETPVGINHLINTIIKKDNFGYFKYKNYDVFIWSSGNLNKFVRETSEIKTFNYIYTINNLPHPSINSDVVKLWSYIYEKGHFSVATSPFVDGL
jgi:hypothetical protein